MSGSAAGGERAPGVLPAVDAVEAGALTLGAHSYGNPTLLMWHPRQSGRVRVGSYCSIADGVEFMVGGNHRADWVTTFPLRVKMRLPGAMADGAATTKGDIVVGNDVWLGADARVLSGVEIGDGAVIGTKAVVASDVRPYAIVAGNPAREVRRRFADDVVEALLRIAWWDWPDETVRARVEELCGPDVEAFVREHDRPGE